MWIRAWVHSGLHGVYTVDVSTLHSGLYSLACRRALVYTIGTSCTVACGHRLDSVLCKGLRRCHGVSLSRVDVHSGHEWTRPISEV